MYNRHRLILKTFLYAKSASQHIKWAPISNYPNIYVSDNDFLLSSNKFISVIKDLDDTHFQIILTHPVRHGSPYLTFEIYHRDGTRTSKLLHRVRLTAFQGQPPTPDKRFVRHINGNPTDNSIDNLAWGTHHENMSDLRRTGSLRGQRNPASTISDCDAVLIYALSNLRILNDNNYRDFCHLSMTQINNIKYGRRWSHVITDSVRHMLNKAIELQNTLR